MKQTRNTNEFERSTDRGLWKSAKCYMTRCWLFTSGRKARVKQITKSLWTRQTKRNTHTNDRLVSKTNTNEMANKNMPQQTAKGMEIAKILYMNLYLYVYTNTRCIDFARQRPISSSQRHLFARQSIQYYQMPERPLRHGLRMFSRGVLLKLSSKRIADFIICQYSSIIHLHMFIASSTHSSKLVLPTVWPSRWRPTHLKNV